MAALPPSLIVPGEKTVDTFCSNQPESCLNNDRRPTVFPSQSSTISEEEKHLKSATVTPDESITRLTLNLTNLGFLGVPSSVDAQRSPRKSPRNDNSPTNDPNCSLEPQAHSPRQSPGPVGSAPAYTDDPQVRQVSRPAFCSASSSHPRVRAVSDRVTKVIANVSPVAMCSPISDQQADQLRLDYAELLSIADRDHMNKVQLRMIFEELAFNISHEILTNLGRQPVSDADDYFLVAKSGEQRGSVLVSSNPVSAISLDSRSPQKRISMLVGRLDACDISPQVAKGRDEREISRVHVVVTIIPGIMVLVIDPGSLNGLEGKGDKARELRKSNRGARSVMRFDWLEPFSVRLSAIPGHNAPCLDFFWVKPCCMCSSTPSDVNLSCGHRVVCKNCLPRLKKCPDCHTVLYSPSSGKCTIETESVPPEVLPHSVSSTTPAPALVSLSSVHVNSTENTFSVHQWLKSIGMGQHSQLFSDQGITLRSLCLLTDSELISMGVTNIGPRLILLDEIAKLKGGAPKSEVKPQQASLVETVLKQSRRALICENDVNLQEEIGHGFFSKVFKGTWKGAVVAIKRCNMPVVGSEGLLQEAAHLASCTHPFVVTFYGAYTDNLDRLCMLTEFAPNGALPQFLERNRRNLSPLNLIRMAKDSAQGMMFLHSQQLVHRNILVFHQVSDGHFLTKVTDFGLSRHTQDYYIATAESKFPAKWTAPEAIEFRRFSFLTDIWSFGIVLWEIFSFGAVPYPTISNADVLDFIKTGKRLSQPQGCPNEVYSLMLRCWDMDPYKRPDFTHIWHELEQFILQEQETPEHATRVAAPSNVGNNETGYSSAYEQSHTTTCGSDGYETNNVKPPQTDGSGIVADTNK